MNPLDIFKTTLVGTALTTSMWCLSVPNVAAASLNSATIAQSALSSDCLDYEVVGICIWLTCSPFGCYTSTSVKVKHYIPELVVSSYERTGENPWKEVSLLSAPVPGARGGGGSSTDQQDTKYSSTRFKNVDAIGHPGLLIFNSWAKSIGFACSGATEPYMPHFLSTIDQLAWRDGLPESVYPEALIPGRRELGQVGDLWGNIYPRSGFATQTNDYKAAALMAQRAADFITRTGQPHVYQSLHPKKRDGYWPPDPVEEGDDSTHKWQPLAPEMENSCAVWPDRGMTDTYADRQDASGDYAWALWRPYSCCKKRGKKLIFHTGN